MALPPMARRQIAALPLAELAAPAADGGCLVLVWLTNNWKYWQFVHSEAFAQWGCRYVTTWYWLKVTNDGWPVLPLSAGGPHPPLRSCAGARTSTACHHH